MDGVKRSLIAAGVLGLLMTGCSAGSSLFTTVPESLPESMGGLPADAPAPPVKPYGYPAVHDMPPPRTTTPLDDSQQLRLEQELEAARDRQAKRAAAAPEAEDAAEAPEKAAPAPKKKPPAAKKRPGTDGRAGAKTGP
jgi:hypothetical protein